MKTNPQDTQMAFQVIGQLASLAATPNISQANIYTVNEEIEKLLEKIIKPAIAEVTATAAGIIIK